MPRPRLVLPSGPGVGSIEHYWHFMVGYLLPTVGILRRELGPWGENPGARVTLRTCGPVMDRVLEEVLTPSGLDLTFGRITARRHPSLRERVGLERMIQVPRPDSEDWWANPTLPADFDDLARSSTALDELLALQPAPEHSAHLRDRVIVLRRSAQPDFYAHGAGAEIPSYGTGRRSLTNVDAVVEGLVGAGVAANAYEPGEHSLRCQAAVFAGAAGIVGMRGAELTNLLWAAEGTPVVVIEPSQFTSQSPAVRLAEFRRLVWTAVPVTTWNASIDVEQVLPHLVR